MSYTLITGATGGLGSAFARLCAERGEHLFLTARDGQKLDRLAAELRAAYGTEVLTCPCQLQESASRAALFSFARARSLTFSRLINAAGADIQKGFCEYTQEKIVFQTRVNFEAAVSLTHFVLETRAPQLEILTVSSVSGIYPMPYFALYSATKKALEHFFSALHAELRGQNVKVTTVLPGAMPTRKDICEQIEGQGLWGKIAAKSPAYVARKSLEALRKNRRTFIPGLANKLMRVLTAAIPLPLKMKFIAARWSKISKDAF